MLNELFLWTGFSIALGWLQKPPNNFKAFVANPVAKIISVVGTGNMCQLTITLRIWVPVVVLQLWWNGPTWLSQPCDLWPELRAFEPTNLKTKKVATYDWRVSLNNIGKNNALLQEENEYLLKRFSSFAGVLRVISYSLRLINRVRKRHFYTESFITSEEIKFTKKRLIYLAKLNYFPYEHKCLQNKQPVNKKSRLSIKMVYCELKVG